MSDSAVEHIYNREQERISVILHNGELDSRGKENALLDLRSEYEGFVQAARETLATPGIIDMGDGLRALTHLEVYQQLQEEVSYVAEEFYHDYTMKEGGFDGPEYAG